MRLTLFDLDQTLLPIDSDYAWGVFTQDLGWTDRVVFLADGRVVEELRAPTPERVLAAMARLDQPVGA